MIGIYKITNKVNGKCYIGQSIHIQQRLNRHKTAPFNPNDQSKNTPLYQAIRKYGLDNFHFEVLCECAKEELNEKEQFYIAQYKSHNRKYGYNQTDGGDNVADVCKKLNRQKVLSIIAQLKTTTSISDIALQYGVGMTLIYQINRGDLFAQDDERYPIRKPYTANKKQRPPRFCAKCGKPISPKATICETCLKYTIPKDQRPNKINLAQQIAAVGFEAVGREFGVSGNAIKKWCSTYGLPTTKKELVSWVQSQNKIT